MGTSLCTASGSTFTVEEKLVECAVNGDLIGTDKWAEKALLESALQRGHVVGSGMEIMDAGARRALEEDRGQCKERDC
jgi:hypothetical protein